MADVSLAAVQHLGLLHVDVEAEDGKAGVFEEKDQRQADVAEADHADPRGARANRIEENFRRLHVCG